MIDRFDAAKRNRWIDGFLSLMCLASWPLSAEELLDQFGKSHELNQSESYTVVDFAAAWCKPCYQALPELEALAEAHPRIRFLVVSVDDSEVGRDRLIEALDLRLPVIWDKAHSLVESFDPKGFPATYVLDASGNVLYQHFGYSGRKWRALVDFVDDLETAGLEIAVTETEAP